MEICQGFFVAFESFAFSSEHKSKTKVNGIFLKKLSNQNKFLKIQIGSIQDRAKQVTSEFKDAAGALNKILRLYNDSDYAIVFNEAFEVKIHLQDASKSLCFSSDAVSFFY